LARWMQAPPRQPQEDPKLRAAETLKALNAQGLCLPIVAKPDQGMRGAGVRVIRKLEDLANYYATFPAKEPFILQELIDEEGEAGVFYVRKPSEQKGRIISLTLKYFPYVTGDGTSTLKELIERDPRAGPLKHIYLPRHAHRLDMVLAAGQPFRIAFAGSHSRGTIFRNGAPHITEAMTQAFDTISRDIREFYFGRFDIRFADIEEVRQGRGFKIIEVNGAGAEATHIWDRNTTLSEAYRALMQQYKAMWSIGRENQLRGYVPVKLIDILAANERERGLAERYPITE
ncbi:MAG TPA: D-alanine--D-alanine ligase, partial [Alphaproteobacteria bacterium]|nr:D-alanine--D-alanine ligase [Alphaproteobacteria bacterium]